MLHTDPTIANYVVNVCNDINNVEEGTMYTIVNTDPNET